MTVPTPWALTRKILCSLPYPLWFHSPKVIEEFDEATRKLRCTSCGKYFAMSDRHMSVVPWDDEFEQIVRDTYGVPRTKV